METIAVSETSATTAGQETTGNETNNKDFNGSLAASLGYQKIVYKTYDKTGAVHVYGIDENDKHRHLKHCDILQAFGHDENTYYQARGNVRGLKDESRLQKAESNVDAWLQQHQDDYWQQLYASGWSKRYEPHESAVRVHNYAKAAYKNLRRRVGHIELEKATTELSVASTALASVAVASAVLASASIVDRLPRRRSKKTKNRPPAAPVQPVIVPEQEATRAAPVVTLPPQPEGAPPPPRENLKQAWPKNIKIGDAVEYMGEYWTFFGLDKQNRPVLSQGLSGQIQKTLEYPVLVKEADKKESKKRKGVLVAAALGAAALVGVFGTFSHTNSLLVGRKQKRMRLALKYPTRCI
jgi:hypothetical protein